MTLEELAHLLPNVVPDLSLYLGPGRNDWTITHVTVAQRTRHTVLVDYYRQDVPWNLGSYVECEASLEHVVQAVMAHGLPCFVYEGDRPPMELRTL